MADVNSLKDAGNKAFAAKNYDQAIDLFTQAIAVDPKNHVLYSNRSAAKAGKKLWSEALEDADECTRVNPIWSKGFARKGAALHGLRRWNDAIAAYEQGIALEGESPSAALVKGLKEVKDAQKADRAENPIGGMFKDPKLFQKLAANPKTAPLLADQAFVSQLKAVQENPQLASSAFQDPRMIQVMGVLLGVDMEGFDRRPGQAGRSPTFDTPPSSPPRQQPASSSSSKPNASLDSTMADPEDPIIPPAAEPMEQDSPEEDEDAKAKAAALKEKELGNASYKQREFADAEAHFSKAWDLWPKDMTFLTNLAAVYFEQGQYSKTIETCEKAIEEGRSFRADYKLVAKAYGRIGSAYLKQDDFDNGIKAFNKSLSEHRTPDVLNKLRDAEREKKQKDIEAYINPDLSAAAREEGNKLFKGGDFVGSVKSYTESIARDPSDARGYTNRAAAYQKLVALPEALKDTDKAVEVDPKYVKAYIRKSLVLSAMREHTKAMEAIQRASDADTERKHTSEIENQLQKISTALYSERSNETEEETLARAMRDPEVASIMQDPVIQQILTQAQQDPKALMDHMKNPVVREKINKLVAAGIIKTR